MTTIWPRYALIVPAIHADLDANLTNLVPGQMSVFGSNRFVIPTSLLVAGRRRTP